MVVNFTTSEIIKRCLAAASSCVEVGNDRVANDLMKDEFREVAREVAYWQLSGEAKAELFLVPMEVELINRHGQQVGRSLYSDFIAAFWTQSWTDIPLDRKRLERNRAWSIDWHQKVQADVDWRRGIINSHFSTVPRRN